MGIVSGFDIVENFVNVGQNGNQCLSASIANTGDNNAENFLNSTVFGGLFDGCFGCEDILSEFDVVLSRNVSVDLLNIWEKSLEVLRALGADA
jgi:hypothetical protein